MSNIGRLVTKTDRGGEGVNELKERLKAQNLWAWYLWEREALYTSGRDRAEAIQILSHRFGPECTAQDREDCLVIDGIEIRQRGDFEKGLAMRGTSVAEYVAKKQAADVYAPKKKGQKVAEKKAAKKEVEKVKEIAPGVVSAPAVVNVNAIERTPADKYRDRLPDGCPLFDPDDFKDNTDLYHDATWTEGNLGRKDITESNLKDHAPSLSCAVYYWSARYTREGYDNHKDTMKKLTIADKSNLRRMNQRDDDGEILTHLDSVLSAVKRMSEDEG